MLRSFMDDENVICQAEFFFENEYEEYGHCVSIRYFDTLPHLPVKKKYIRQFEEKGFKVVDYEVTMRPVIRTPDLLDHIDHSDKTKH